MNAPEVLHSDLERLAGDHSFKSFVKWYFFGGGHPYRWTYWWRLATLTRQGRQKFLFPICWMLMRHYEFKLGVHASTKLSCGKGLLIAHGDCVYLYAERIGDNCTFYQGVTLGRTETGVPVIGNNVTVFAGASVLGGIHIGDGATIGAGAVVVKDVPSGATVIGVPAKVLSTDC
jgi:serine O-acetyltransferase